MTLDVASMILRKAACAAGVTVSASSKMMILKGGLGYCGSSLFFEK